MSRLLASAAILAVAALLGPLLPASAQTGGGVVGFDHRGGNEWWVEAVPTGASAGSVVAMEAASGASPWKPMEKKSWGNWAVSIHIPSGALVRFRATMSDGARVESCPFTHPAGEERCPTGPAPPFGATFSTNGGNAWWVAARVDATRPLAGVDARVSDGAWAPLKFQDWGEWAASMRAPDGSLVQFRARASDGSEAVSGRYVWPRGTPYDEPQTRPPPANETPPPTPPGGARRLAAFGDTGVDNVARMNVEGAVKDGATGYLGLGDYAYEHPPGAWLSMMEPLTRQGAWLALGNHDNASDYPPFFRNGTWSASNVSGMRVVIVDGHVDMRPGSVQHEFVRAALCDAPEPLRVILAHQPWWLQAGAVHPGHEFPASGADMDALVRDCGVDLVLASHEHNYQRAMRGDVAYLVVGTGGRPLYPVRGMAEGTVAAHMTHGRLLLDVRPDGYDARFVRLDGTALDAWNATAEARWSGPAAPPPGTAPRIAFDHAGGNEWWVEARIEGLDAGRVTRVAAQDEGMTTWTELTKRSWGAYAASFRIEPGHKVRFQATLDTGALVTSCMFTHPAGVESCDGGAAPPPPPPSGFDATFVKASGNEWWVQMKVQANAPLAGVDARVDGGAWRPLTLQSWGDWAASFHVPAWSQVQFRARAAEGGEDLSGPYDWPPA